MAFSVQRSVLTPWAHPRRSGGAVSFPSVTQHLRQVCREGLGNDSNQTLQIRSRQRLVALAKESNYFFLWLAVRSDTTYIKFFTVYPEPLRIVTCCQSASGEPVNPSRSPSSQHRAVSFELGLPTENALAFSRKTILPIPKDHLQCSPK